MVNDKYSSEEIQEIAKKYELSQEELDKTIDLICDCLTLGVQSHEHPIAVVVGGQSGGGKTGIIGYAQKCLKDDNIIIDNDTYREFHPKIKEINSKYAELMTDCTDQLSFYATPIIIDRMIKGKYNLVIHQTLKSKRIADDAMQKLRDNGYTVGVMALAVASVESYLSMMERCLVQLKIDRTCRWVDPINQDKAFNSIPDTLSYIENDIKNYNFIQVVMRGKTNPTSPRIIYCKLNEKNTAQENELIEKYFKTNIENTYKDSVDAIKNGRILSEDETLKKIDDRLIDAAFDDFLICGHEPSEAKDRIKILRQTVKEIRAKK